MVVRKREREWESLRNKALNWRHQNLTSTKINYMEGVLSDKILYRNAKVNFPKS